MWKTNIFVKKNYNKVMKFPMLAKNYLFYPINLRIHNLTNRSRILGHRYGQILNAEVQLITVFEP